jgi:fatty acid desaturase
MIHDSNIVVQLAFIACLIWALGTNASGYLIMSISPVSLTDLYATQSLSEQYMFDATALVPNQTNNNLAPVTSSCRVLLNIFAYNVGFQHEHHKFAVLLWS